MSASEDSAAPTKETIFLLGVFFIFVVIVLRRSFLLESLWLDETVSFWVIKDTWGELVSRSFEYQGQSPLYFGILKAWSDVFGTSELSLRLPSLLALITSGFLLFKLAANFGGIGAGLLAVCIFTAIDGVLVTWSARPYAFALLSVIVSWIFLERLIAKSDIKNLSLYLLFLVSGSYFHPLYSLVIIAQFLFVLGVCFFSSQLNNFEARKKLLLSWLLVATLWVLLCIPVWFQVYFLSTRGIELAFAQQPKLKDPKTSRN